MHRRPPNHALRAIPGLPAPGRRGPRWRVAALGRGPGEGRRGGRWGGGGAPVGAAGEMVAVAAGGEGSRDARCEREAHARSGRAEREARAPWEGPGAFDGGCFRPRPVYGYCQRRGPLGGGRINRSLCIRQFAGRFGRGGRGAPSWGHRGRGFWWGAVQTKPTPAGSPGGRPPRRGR